MTAEAARIYAGLSLEEVGKRLKRCPRYLRQIELHGNAPEHLARRLANLYQCPMEIFLYGPKPKKRKKPLDNTPIPVGCH